ncbi:MAG: DUF433 domain-containing protein, partial [Acidobacteriota bacterium]
MTTISEAGVARQTITQSYLELDEDGRAWIKGANTKVIEVALDWIAYRWNAEEIHRQHPHLALPQIHAALAYYFDHQPEIDEQVRQSQRRIELMRAESGE